MHHNSGVMALTAGSSSLYLLLKGSRSSAPCPCQAVSFCLAGRCGFFARSFRWCRWCRFSFGVGGRFFPRANFLYDASTHGSGLFGRERLGAGDAKLLPVRARIEVVLSQVTRRELLKGLTADQALNGVFFDALLPVFGLWPAHSYLFHALPTCQVTVFVGFEFA